MYDYIFITLDSSFYKVNLYNELNKKAKIFVIFLCTKNRYRSDEFLNTKKEFEFIYLSDSFYENRKKLKNSLKILKILKTKKYRRVVLGGWDSLENWSALFVSPKEKNGLAVESSEFESKVFGIKGWIKRLFLLRVSYAFASGESQKRLLLNLKFKGRIIKTKGVGILNLKNYPNKIRQTEKIDKFIFVGGLIPVKNVAQIIRVFNKLPELTLSIVGRGDLEKELKEMSNKNINFLGHIENNKLGEIYEENHVFILPSKSEAWGLVVEEALSKKLPVILSNKVGCSTELISNEKHGYIYDINNDNELLEAITKIINFNNYTRLKRNVEKIDFDKSKKNQLKAYLEVIQ